jgi:uncharacterized coiled-coil protein SlyX
MADPEEPLAPGTLITGLSRTPQYPRARPEEYPWRTNAAGTPPVEAPPRVTLGSAFGALGNVTQAPTGAALGSLIDRPGDLGSVGRAAWDTLKTVPPTVFEGAQPLTSPAQALRSRGVDIGPGLGLYTDLMLDPLSMIGGDPLTAASKLAITGAEHVPQLVRGAKGLVEGAMQTARGASQEHAAGRFLADLMTGEAGSVKLPDIGTPPPTPPDRGLYSRVDEVAGRVPAKGVHPSKLAGWLKDGASSEEVAYRGLPEFLAGKGNQPVTQAELRAHLEAHPAPFPETKVLGEPAVPPTFGPDFPTWLREQDPNLNLADLSPELVQALQRAHADLPPATRGRPAVPTKYQSYTLPGGENYRESLYTLPDPVAAQRAALEQERHALGELVDKRSPNMSRQELDALIARHDAKQAEIDALPTPTTYRSSHFDDPNVLAHARTTERTLPVTGLRSNEELEPLIQQAVNAKSPASIASGAPDAAVRKGLITPEEAQQYGAAKGFYGFTAPTGPRGRFIEEIQSDWHQAGKRQGYQTPASPEQQQHLAQLTEQVAQARAEGHAAQTQLEHARGRFLDLQQRETIPRLAPEYAHLQDLQHALNEGRGSTAAWRAARGTALEESPALRAAKTAELEAEERVRHATIRHMDLAEEHRQLSRPSGVPDAPFKDTWPDLALKQQLLDVARDPHANWLGFTSGKTQAARYDLSKQVSRLSFEPDTAHDFSAGTLVAHDLNGDEVMRHQLQPHEFDEHIGKEPADALRRKIAEHEHARDAERAQWSVERDPDIPDRFYVVDPNGEPMHDYAGRLERFRHEDDAHARIADLLRADQEMHGVPPSIEGLDLQVGGEGMRHFYDQLLPARLRKLLKPFGGTVEPFDLPQPPWPQGPFEQTPAPGWITRLTPEMKRRILERGFPLLTLPLGVAAGSLASRPGDDVGTPPPVPAPRAQ